METDPAKDLAANRREWSPDDFRTPPVTSRQFLVQLDISKQDFEQRAPKLLDFIQKEGAFEERNTMAQWDFRLDVQDNVPKPKVLLTHIPALTRAGSGGIPKTTIELHPPIESNPAKLIIEQDRTDDFSSRYQSLEHEIHTWLPTVMEHFKTKRVAGFLLQYRNLIEKERYPLFWEGENTLQLGKVLWLFKHNIGPGSFVTPFSVDFNSSCKPKQPGNIRFSMKTVQPNKKEFALEVLLAYNSLGSNDKRTSEKLFVELADAHKLLFDNFVRQFLDDALEAFTQ